MKAFLEKLIPDHSRIPLLLTVPSLMVSYQGAKLVQALFGMPYVFDLTLSIDRCIPFSAPWVLVYFGSYLFWIYVYLMGTRQSPLMAWSLLTADWIAKLLSLGFFLFLPTTNSRPEITGQGICDQLMELLYFVDTPTNLFPSAHCLIAWLGTRFIFCSKELPHRKLHCWISATGCVLVFLSTLYTKQHVLVDILGAIAVSETGFYLSFHSNLPQKLQRLLKHKKN